MAETKETTANKAQAAETKPDAKQASAEHKPAEKNSGAAHNQSKDAGDKANAGADSTAAGIVGQAKDKATSLLDTQKTSLAAGIGTVADSIRHIGENLRGDNEENQIAGAAAKYGDSLAEQVENISHYVENKNFKELARDLEQFARRNPGLFAGGALVLGILTARFLKSSDSGRTKSGGRQLSSGKSAPVQAS